MIDNLFIVVETSTIILCLFALYRKKFKLDICTMTVFFANILTLYLINLEHLDTSASAISYIFIFLYCLVEFDKSIKRAIVNNVLYIIVISIFQLISAVPFVIIGVYSVAENSALIVINMLSILAVILFRKQIGDVSDAIYKRQWLTFIVVIICIMMVASIIIKFKYQYKINEEYYALGAMFLTLTIILVQKWSESQKEAGKKQLELEMATIYNAAFEELIQNVRRQQHDINNQFNAIYSLHHTANSLEELVDKQKEYCHNMQQSMKLSKILSVTIPALGGFLYSKLQTMESNGICVDTDVKMNSESINVPIYELIAVLGVLLDNAMEELLDKDDKRAKLAIAESENCLRISVSNICEYKTQSELEMMFEPCYSTKGVNRGIGLYNVKEKAEKYAFGIMANNEDFNGENWLKFSVIISK